MSVVLNPNPIKKTGNLLSTLPSTRIRRTLRVKEDLDKFFYEEQAQSIAQTLGLSSIDLYGFPIESSALASIPAETAKKYHIGAFSFSNQEIYLATNDPHYPGQEEFLKEFGAKRKYKLFICSQMSFDKLLNAYNAVVKNKDVDDSIQISTERMDNKTNQTLSLDELNTVLAKTSISEMIETVLIAALQNNASDIHFEPEKESYKLRLRLDGVLHTFADLPKENQKAVESRIKIISGLKINVDNIPQDGRFTFKASDKDIDVRVSMLPSNYGYSIVMRLLGTGSVGLDLDLLGFTGTARDRINAAIQKPQGLILTTGPTGSGKTTTLYSFLKTLNDGESKIITLEDPIEYKLDGISQTQIDAAAGYTFSSGLRSILRQDPDVVLVGEIRDKETAEIAIQASLTGHQVLSTIHTNDAAGSIPRLMEMGVKGFLLADSLAVVIGQRLVRRLCEYCKHDHTLTVEERSLVIEQLSKLPGQHPQIPLKMKFLTSDGCSRCNGLGYKGRIGVYEVMVVGEKLRDLLSTQFPSINQVRQVAAEEGMLTMMQDGILKALQGHTDLKELIRNISS
jgi:type II secretory ATPase GspE/PulE/Tfp pilus assembly ATPase PilB-like protein